MAPNPEFPSIAWAGPASSGRSRSGLGPYRYITWHCTSNPTSDASGEAAFARNRTDGVGTHATADASAFLQTQVTSLSVGHVGSSTGNRYGVAIEMCGVESDSAAHWRPIVDRCVPWVRLVMAKYGIANRWLTLAQMRDGRSTGHITHDMARIAWGSTDHTDPGPNFDKNYVLTAVAGSSTEDNDMDLDDFGPKAILPGATNRDVMRSMLGLLISQATGTRRDDLIAWKAAEVPDNFWPAFRQLTAAGGPTDEQVAAQADRIAAALVARPDNPLGDADQPAIVAAVKQALREGVA